MRLLRYILVPWTIILVYSFFSIVFGQNGLYMRKSLQAEQARLAEHSDTLKAVRKNYMATKDSLLNDADVLSVYARQLGYSRGDEEFVRIMGLGIAAQPELPAGQVAYSITPSHVSDNMIKMISMLFGLAILVFFVINDFEIIRDKVFQWYYTVRARILSR